MSARRSSKQWLKEHSRDPFVKQAQQAGYRSRAVYKLMEIDNRDRLLRPGMSVIDLGAAPGAWSQYVSQIVGPAGRVIALDKLPMEPVKNVSFMQGDLADKRVRDRLTRALAKCPVDLVISDLAPNMSGIKATDEARMMRLLERVSDLAFEVLKPGGTLLVKGFQGVDFSSYVKELRKHFQHVSIRKPKASRQFSSEVYVLARSYVV
ncbi:MAG: RlmE family RNA methyltransferase [Gammaproteobacteria bacterium]|nr:RlmE family RNA methyltransferase [Gammaproteobacteria bacterium]MCI0591358.1 RlmE family RNA methyltransferase [Gammaproteobacteria bacterium]